MKKPNGLTIDEIGPAIEKLLGVRVSRLELSPREHRVLEARVLMDKPVPLDELAAEFGIARERVRQIETLVREKMTTDD
jgi:DNA-directed RNA polymerase sigma subunit (sigma70/sigma32)